MKHIVAAVLLGIASMSFGYTQEDINTANYLAEQGLIVDKSNHPNQYRLDDTISRAEVVGTALKLA